MGWYPSIWVARLMSALLYGAGLRVLEWLLETQTAREGHAKKLQEVGAAAAGDVDHLARHRPGAGARQEVGPHDVADVREVSGLRAVSVDHGPALAEHRLGEPGNDRGVERVRALAGSEDVEVPQADTREAVTDGVGAQQKLARALGGRVG